MVRLFGPRPDLGFAQLHAHIEPFPEWPALVEVGEAFCLPGYTCTDHLHAVHEFTYVMSGSGVRTVDGRPDALQAQDFHLVRAGELHRSRAAQADPYHVCYLLVDPARLPLAPEPFAELSARPSQTVGGVAGGEKAFRRLLTELDRCEAAGRRQRSLCLAMAQALASEIVLRFTGALVDREEALAAATPERRAFQEVVAWLRTRLADPPALGEMAKRAGLSPGHFTAAFKREVGRTPIEFITALRIDEAARRLHAPDESVARVAADLGFASAGYLSRVFRSAKGCSPSEWRARHGL